MYLQQALNFLYYIMNKFFNFIFEDMILTSSPGYVNFGWVILAIMVFGIIIKNVLAVPSNLHMHINTRKKED